MVATIYQRWCRPAGRRNVDGGKCCIICRFVYFPVFPIDGLQSLKELVIETAFGHLPTIAAQQRRPCNGDTE